MSGLKPQRGVSGALSGTLVGHYRFEEQIGAGGMGVVYRAIDTTLRRSVAIKLLPEHCATDPGRRSRLEREAHLLASLSHPHIAAIYGFETADPVCFLVLEYVPGETLAERLVANALPMGEALRIASEIAEALEAAHEHGIVHRDLKPSNVKITPDGSVKVLDFGLGKAFESAAASDSVETATVLLDDTQPGTVLGTAAYMSPEQARAQPTDKRTDIWSFGCVLYEMLARRQVFEGATTSDCIAAVLGREPDWRSFPANTPQPG